MEGFITDWLNLAIRWFHVVVAIAWIGESFYFVALDNSLKPPQNPGQRQRGVFGELWHVHGGGFYNMQKYTVAPPEMPDDLHWSKWPSYTTWLSGFGLFTVLYLFAPNMVSDRQERARHRPGGRDLRGARVPRGRLDRV